MYINYILHENHKSHFGPECDTRLCNILIHFPSFTRMCDKTSCEPHQVRIEPLSVRVTWSTHETQ